MIMIIDVHDHHDHRTNVDPQQLHDGGIGQACQQRARRDGVERVVERGHNLLARRDATGRDRMRIIVIIIIILIIVVMMVIIIILLLIPAPPPFGPDLEDGDEDLELVRQAEARHIIAPDSPEPHRQQRHSHEQRQRHRHQEAQATAAGAPPRPSGDWILG
jgi:hypothetical protein